jgi:hypothetical protein
VIPTSDLQLLSEYVMNAPSETIKTNVWFVVVKVSRMPFIALNVRDWKRIEMDVRRLLISEVRGRICFVSRLGILGGGGDALRDGAAMASLASLRC